MRADDRRKPGVQRRHDPCRIIHRQRGLGDIGKTRLVAHMNMRNIGFGFNQQNLARRQLAHGADGFGVALVADHHHLQTSLKMAFRLDMHFADKRAGSVHEDHFAARGLGGYGFGHTVGRKDHRAAFGHIVQFLDKHGTKGAQSIDDKFIVHDFMAYIHRCAPFHQRQFNDLDRPVHPRAKAARCGKVKGQGWF